MRILYSTLLYSAYVEAVREGNHAPFRSTRVDDDGVGQTDRRTDGPRRCLMPPPGGRVHNNRICVAVTSRPGAVT